MEIEPASLHALSLKKKLFDVRLTMYVEWIIIFSAFNFESKINMKIYL